MSAPERIWINTDAQFDGMIRPHPEYGTGDLPEYVHNATHREELARVWDAVGYLCREALDTDIIRETAERAAKALREGSR